jgi:hypothetical protein
VSGTGEWSPGPLLELAELLGGQVGAWNHMQYPDQVPAAGQHSAEAITAGHDAVRVIDEMIRDLHALRGQLVAELRADDDANLRRDVPRSGPLAGPVPEAPVCAGCGSAGQLSPVRHRRTGAETLFCQECQARCWDADMAALRAGSDDHWCVVDGAANDRRVAPKAAGQ